MTQRTASQEPPGLRRLEEELDLVLTSLDEAPGYAKIRHQTELFRVAADLLDSDEGLQVLFRAAPRLEAAGAFHQGPWEDPGKLLPPLVGAGLRSEGVVPTVEALSELRLLAVAVGDATSEHVDADAARAFLQEACAKNLDLLLRRETEESRTRPKIFARAWRLFGLIGDHISLAGLRGAVLAEVEALCAQRPIQTEAARELIRRAAELPDEPGDDPRFDVFRRALEGPTARSRRADDLAAYRRELGDLDLDALVEESRRFASVLHATGLVHPYHAVVLRRVAKADPARIGAALGLDQSRQGAAEPFADEIRSLVVEAVQPHTASAILGLMGVLDRALLSRNEVAAGLRRIAELDIRPEVAKRLLAPTPDAAGLTANSVLLAGCLCVLGQPLGMGQGNNPTCQAARGISLWSLHAPGLLLGMIATAARDGFVSASFEGQELRSDRIEEAVATTDATVDPSLDPVSRLLVPHLDRIYARMLTLAALRGEDAHKWVNPAIYGRWVARGFSSAIDPVTHRVTRHESFVRLFFATHHPDYNDGHELIYPNPVGIMVTDVHARLLGPHAVSLQRIAPDPDGTIRAYFFNPNNEGRQDWGGGVKPSVWNHGERHGESSLPLDQFASRLYAFHYDPQELGEAYAVPDDLVAAISNRAAESWGRGMQWGD